VRVSVYLDRLEKEREKKKREKMEILFFIFIKKKAVDSIDLNDKRVAWRLTLLVCI
jgi:hypothetical protein